MLAAPLLAAGAVAAWDPTRRGGPPVCPLRACTGVACPLCGLTRAAGSLLHGRVHQALSLHPLIVLVFVEVAALWLAYALGRASWFARHPNVRGALVWCNVVLFAGVWVARLATGSIHTVE